MRMSNGPASLLRATTVDQLKRKLLFFYNYDLATADGVGGEVEEGKVDMDCASGHGAARRGAINT